MKSSGWEPFKSEALPSPHATSMTKVLALDDQAEVAETIGRTPQSRGLQPVLAFVGQTALAQPRTELPDRFIQSETGAGTAARLSVAQVVPRGSPEDNLKGTFHYDGWDRTSEERRPGNHSSRARSGPVCSGETR